MSHCQGCGEPLPPQSYRGRKRKWCSDFCRRHTSYSRPCADCGKPTYSGDANPPERCVPCTARHKMVWTEGAILTAIRAWAADHGGIPPAATDWSPAMALTIGHPEKAEKFYADDAWPHTSTVQDRFGTWNAAIRAAGLAPRPTGTYGREGEDPALCREIAERYEAGESPIEMAREYACAQGTIIDRARRGGARIRSVEEGTALMWERRHGIAA